MRGNVFEAFGTRPSEVGSTLDRQKANTKDEESDLGLLNEGFRWRELSTGTFLTRDPLGFVDGPNLYAYVNDNPWTMFDPEGLLFTPSSTAPPVPPTTTPPTIRPTPNPAFLILVGTALLFDVGMDLHNNHAPPENGGYSPSCNDGGSSSKETNNQPLTPPKSDIPNAVESQKQTNEKQKDETGVTTPHAPQKPTEEQPKQPAQQPTKPSEEAPKEKNPAPASTPAPDSPPVAGKPKEPEVWGQKNGGKRGNSPEDTTVKGGHRGGRPSTEETHQHGDSRRRQDQKKTEKGDDRRD